MRGFRDPASAAKVIERLKAMAEGPLPPFISGDSFPGDFLPGESFPAAFEGNPDPDRALKNLERWLRATASPWLHLQQIAGVPRLGRRLILLLGSSQPLADCLIQNPELSGLILEPGQLEPAPDRAKIVEAGQRLLADTTSYTHELDRLRYLRQRWNVPIVTNDLSGGWTQEKVWSALSEVAMAMIELAYGASWQATRRQRELPEQCPVLVVAFGKLGGDELNYSSDVDLVYVCEDDLPEKLERNSARFLEALGRALSDRLGRGSLYRVDLRLRPYGAAGPIVRSMRSMEAYYNLYAEHWEVQALLRSQPVCGPPELAERWEEMRVKTCFRPKLSEVALEEMLSMRRRIEQGAEPEDLKRGPGGIRDVEFLIQVLQLLHGRSHPELQVRPTCEAIRRLEEASLIEHPVAASLLTGYTFLRKLEHRIQLVGDRQTHTLPSSEEERERLAILMGTSNWAELDGILDAHRRTIQSLYRSSLQPDHLFEGEDARQRVAVSLGSLGPAAVQWFDVLPARDAFYQGLLEDRDSLERVRRILATAPRLVADFKRSLPLTEMLLSGEMLLNGEVGEPLDDAGRIGALAADAPLATVAEAIFTSVSLVLARWSLAPSFELGPRLSAIWDAALRHCLARLYAGFDVIVTGSLGGVEMGPGSDADLIFLVAEPERHMESEQQAQQFLSLVSQLRQLGAPLEVDLRLRPEGAKGLLVRTYEGFGAYDLDGMEMWERFALGNARLLVGRERSLEVVRGAAYGLPLSHVRLRELLKMKRRIETERVRPQHLHRDVKLGYGGLFDIDWFVHLQELRYPKETDAISPTVMAERIRRLQRAGHVNAVEAELLTEARRYLLALQARIYLQGLPENLLPENPDKLDRLAAASGLNGANELLARHREVTEAVRRLYLEGLERLRR